MSQLFNDEDLLINFYQNFELSCTSSSVSVDSVEWVESLLSYLKEISLRPLSAQTIVTISQLFPSHLGSSLSLYLEHILKLCCDEDTSKKEKQVAKKQLDLICLLQWSDIFKESVIKAFEAVILAHVNDSCSSNFDEPQIPGLTEWLLDTFSPVAIPLLRGSNEANKLKFLTKLLMKAISHVRANEFFDIVADYPDSLPAVKELKEAMTATASHALVGQVFRASIVKRLLHPGASTPTIVEMYVSMIRALRVLDPSDLVLTYAASPVRAYLMTRKDTVRCVVASLTQDKSGDLYGELRRGGSLEFGVDEDDEDGGPGERWEPRLRNRNLAESGAARGLDVLALLVSIYGSTDLFVTEYRSLLADKLLANISYQTDHEVATLELLKIRFGEEALHSCEVMLRDLEESRRTNTAVVSAIKAKNPDANCFVDYAIVSDHYWPPIAAAGGADIDASTLIEHPTMKAALSAYEDTYKVLKAPRRLDRIPHLGLVQLDLDFDDGSSRSFSVNPIQAMLILHLGDHSPMWMSELSAATGLEATEVRRRMAFWVSKKVVFLKSKSEEESPDGDPDNVLYTVNENQQEVIDAAGSDSDEDASGALEGETADAYHSAREKSTHSAIEAYIKGLVTDGMSLDRLHSMIRLMASGGTTQEVKFDMSLLEFRKYLQVLIDAGKLDFVDGLYCKPSLK